MSRDTQTKMSKSEYNKSKKREEEAKKSKKMAESSDDDASLYSDDDEEDKELDILEYRKFLNKRFPSKHLEQQIKAGEKLKQILKKETCEEDDDDDESEEEQPKSKSKSKKSKPNSHKQEPVKPHPYRTRAQTKQKLIESEEEYETCSDDDDDEDVKPEKINIVLTIGPKGPRGLDEDCDEEEEWDTCSDYSTENEDDPISDSDEEDEEEEETSPCVKPKATDKLPHLIDVDVCDTDIKKAFQQFKDLQANNPNDKLVKKVIALYETEIKKRAEKRERKTQKEKDRNSRIFKRSLRDKNTMNDFDFYDKLDVEQQKIIIKELREINKLIRVEKPYRLTLLESDMPITFKACAIKKISSLRYMEPGSGEYNKLKNWVDTFMRIPFGKNEVLPLTIEDGIEKCHEFMANAQKTLSDAVYGLNDAKMQIMQLLGQLITNPKAIGSAIAIHGPPGTGKTSLVKEGISKILNRPFAFIALGGATDSSFLEGHGYTYEGSTWGKIVQILIDSKCMNPVIYFDELDKISDTPKGEEIAGILTHLTDTSQNNQFHDKYFSEIDFDLSKCLFIFSYNDESKINPILKDRMYRIQTQGYNQKQKTAIANNYLLPKIREQVKFASADIVIPDQTIHYIVEHLCNKEDGVRNLKRCLEIIYTKLNLYRLMRPGSNLFEEDMSIKVEFPFTVTSAIVNKLIKKPTNGINDALSMMIC
jgi:ATP-dependent Lon protease